MEPSPTVTRKLSGVFVRFSCAASESTKRISWYYPETYMEKFGKILNLGENQAEEALVWWKQQFGADFYLEIMRHNQEDENRVNKTLIEFAQKTRG
jgi:DNA polymerase III alpha subunit